MEKPESRSAVMFICINNVQFNFRFVALLTFTGYFWLYLGAGVHLHRSRLSRFRYVADFARRSMFKQLHKHCCVQPRPAAALMITRV